ncbi:MAG: sigma-54 dependent transcriptional regulator [bacterium]|nr:sigma-54 dependent transcriptional regulator [bacterium]
MKPTILVTDDDSSIQGLLATRLMSQDYVVRTASSGEAMLEALGQEEFDSLLLDMHLPDGDGLELIAAVRAIDPNLPIIMITAHGSIEKAVEAMRRGAYDFCPKPIDFNRLTVAVKNAIERNALKRRLTRLERTQKAGLCELIGASPEMQVVYRIIETVASTDAPVMITGESGTGKELAARAIHHLSTRRPREMVEVNCAAIPKDLLESELFGHERNAFTGATEQSIGRCERANRSTLFLDEVAEMDPGLQAKLLRFLQDYSFYRVGGKERITVDVRIVSATNRNPKEAMAEGVFREDLFYRLHVVHLPIPPLRDHAEDIPDLAEHFLGHYARRHEKAFAEIGPEALDVLCAYAWPGNVRELENVIQQAVVLYPGETLTVDMLPEAVRRLHAAPAARVGRGERRPLGEGRDPVIVPFEQLEREAICQALEVMRGNVTKAAAALHLSQATLYRKIRDYNLVLKQFKDGE